MGVIPTINQLGWFEWLLRIQNLMELLSHLFQPGSPETLPFWINYQPTIDIFTTRVIWMVSNEESFTTSFHETECPSARVCGCGYQNAMGNPLEQPGNSGTLHKVIAIVVSAKWYFYVYVYTPEVQHSPWKNDGWNISFLLGWYIFRGYVKLPGGNSVFIMILQMSPNFTGI